MTCTDLIQFKFVQLPLVLPLLNGNCKTSARRSCSRRMTFAWQNEHLIDRSIQGIKKGFRKKCRHKFALQHICRSLAAYEIVQILQ